MKKEERLKMKVFFFFNIFLLPSLRIYYSSAFPPRLPFVCINDLVAVLPENFHRERLLWVFRQSVTLKVGSMLPSCKMYVK